MICRVFTVNDEKDFKDLLSRLNLTFKDCWKRYIWQNKTNYYRLVIFDNYEYGLFTQAQLPIVKSHQELNSASWADYKPYADKGYQEMRPNGVEAGTKTDSSWTPLRKEAFRKGIEWNNFKRDIIEWNTKNDGYVYCEDCKNNISPKLIEVHHIYPELYDVLVRKNFMLLCNNCHKIRTARGE